MCQYCQTPVQSPDFSLGLGVDFVLPLSQQEEQQQEEEQEPHQNIPEGNILEVLNLAKSHTKPKIGNSINESLPCGCQRIQL